MASLIRVDRLVSRIENNQSMLGSNEINNLYGSECARVFKDEVKLIVPGNLDGSPVVMQAPILTDERIEEIRATRIKHRGVHKRPCYLHLGFVPIAINSLLPSGNDDVTGICALVDTSRSSYKNAVIDAFNFKWTKDEPYAAKLLTINAAIDIDCDVSVRSLQIIFKISGIDLDKERSVAAITVGLSCVPTVDMFQLPRLKRECPKISIMNIISSIESDVESREAFVEMFNAKKIDLLGSGKSEMLDKGKRWGFFGPVVKPVSRRNLTSANRLKNVQIKSERCSLKRNGSLNLDRSISNARLSLSQIESEILKIRSNELKDKFSRANHEEDDGLNELFTGEK
ncbi:movement protein [Salvia divinorum RNA virus 1]|uniref:movement protein n=1 Tax=Salvia divinorum RNA virus 1 TaxID=2419804 RepID=UPI000EB6F747|nr:movement protein [Salvia divinorum RNA virus 1]AYE54585.1 movement protein [Salvia divinorum RNA virus 1]